MARSKYRLLPESSRVGRKGWGVGKGLPTAYLFVSCQRDVSDQGAVFQVRAISCSCRHFVLAVGRTAPGSDQTSVCSLDCKNNSPGPDTASDPQHFRRQRPYRMCGVRRLTFLSSDRMRSHRTQYALVGEPTHCVLRLIPSMIVVAKLLTHDREEGNP